MGSFRFRPPPFPLTPEVRWALSRAFAPEAGPWPEPLDAAEAARSARRLGLAERIGARWGRGRLQADLGEGTARALHSGLVQALARGLRQADAARALAAAAADEGIPLVLLKHAALAARWPEAAGCRFASDVDALLPGDRVRGLHRALQARGWRASGSGEARTHLPCLFGPEGVSVELHFQLSGLSTPRRGRTRWAGFAEIEEAGGLEPLATWPGRTSVPRRDLLFAHALAHALWQHGLSDRHPLLRLVADLVDLSAAAPGGRPAAAELRRWIAAEAAGDREVEAAFALASALASGRDLRERPPSADARALLDHALGAALDARYAASLRLRGLLEPTGISPGRWLREVLTQLLAPSRFQLEVIYGRSRGPLGRLGLRVWRPLDLAGRLLRYSLASLRLGWARRARPAPPPGGRRG